MRRCSICGCILVGYGNNAEPINDGRCCDDCNQQVILARIAQISADNFDRKLREEDYGDTGH